MNVLRLQRWMGHNLAAFTLEVYGHLLDDDPGPPLDLRAQTSPADAQATGKAPSRVESAKRDHLSGLPSRRHRSLGR